MLTLLSHACLSLVSLYFKLPGVKQGFYRWWKARRPVFRETFGRLQIDWDAQFGASRRALDAQAREQEVDAFEDIEQEGTHEVPTVSTLGLLVVLLRLPTPT